MLNFLKHLSVVFNHNISAKFGSIYLEHEKKDTIYRLSFAHL